MLDLKVLPWAIIQSVRESLLVLNKDLRVTFANQPFYKTFQVTPKQTEGKLIYELGKQWDTAELRSLLEEVLPKKGSFESFELHRYFPGIGVKCLLLNARVLRQPTDQKSIVLLVIEDITKRRSLENKLARYALGLERKVAQRAKDIAIREARDRAVMESIGNGLIVLTDVDKGGKIIFVNRAFEEMVGWEMREAIGKPITKVIPREDKDGNIVPFKERIITRILSGEKITSDISIPFYYLRKDKTKFPVASVITPVVLDKKIIGAVETFRDITKEVAADKAKTEFASLVSHQLRTPFSIINWHVELLLSQDVGKLNAKQKQYLEEVYRASKRMVDLINVLLSISRIEMGITTPELEPTDLTSLAETILAECQSVIIEKDLRLEKVYGKNLPLIQADRKQLTMIFQNLIANAVKYTPQKGRIRLTILRKGHNVTISVVDSGIGIPKDVQPMIFARFFRADNAKAEDPQGVGLGLYILKAIVDQIGGKTWFTSKEGKGTSFYVTLPLKLAPKRLDKELI